MCGRNKDQRVGTIKLSAQIPSITSQSKRKHSSQKIGDTGTKTSKYCKTKKTRFCPSSCFSLCFVLNKHLPYWEMIIRSATCAFACPQFEWVAKLQFSWETVHCYDENDEVVGGRNALAVLWMMNWSDYRGSIITIVGLSGKPKLNDQRTSMPLHPKNARKLFSFKTDRFLQGQKNWSWMKEISW